MAQISFDDAKKMVKAGNDWLNNVSELIQGTAPQPPTDIYGSQKLAFEISKSELAKLINADKVVGILGMESEAKSLCVILVGLDKEDRPSSELQPCQTWPMMKDMKHVDDVLNGYLKA